MQWNVRKYFTSLSRRRSWSTYRFFSFFNRIENLEYPYKKIKKVRLFCSLRVTKGLDPTISVSTNSYSCHRLRTPNKFLAHPVGVVCFDNMMLEKRNIYISFLHILSMFMFMLLFVIPWHPFFFWWPWMNFSSTKRKEERGSMGFWILLLSLTPPYFFNFHWWI